MGKILSKREEQLEASLIAQDIMLKEIHHRINNELQVIIGLFEIQKEEMSDGSLKVILSELQCRIQSIALIHQYLYEHNNFSSIGFKEFSSKLVGLVKSVFEQRDKEMDVQLIGDEIHLDLETMMPIGLIINELLTNAFKYVYPGTENAKLELELMELSAGNYQLCYHDNGNGLKDRIDIKSAKSLGLKLINGLATQLHGEAIVINRSGCVIRITFKGTDERKKG